MKKSFFVVAPVITMIALVAALAFFKVGHKNAMGIVILALPIVSLISYFIFLQKRDVWSAVRGFCLASIMATLSLLLLFAIRNGEVFISDFSFYQITTILALALAVAVFEEFIFRGLLLGLLTRYFPKLPLSLSLLLQALAFAASHFDKEPLFYVQTMVAGCFLGWTALKTKSLWFPIGFHFGWDLIVLLSTGYHSKNFGHLRGVLIFDVHYAYLQDLVFMVACGVSACIVVKFRAGLPVKAPSLPMPSPTFSLQTNVRDGVGITSQ